MANPAVVVDFIANTKDLQQGMAKAGDASKGFGSKLKAFGKVAGAAALGGLVATLKVGIDEFSEASKVAAQTNAVLKSTGGVANVTAGHINTLAGSLMKKSGVDDEAIQSGENLLLTFTNIRNEAGKGNDVFDQTTKAALDMSTALGTDMKSAAMQLGKALNDPIKGVTKLQRSGVTFTDAQKKMIKSLQDSGNTLGAQKIILAEVNKEFGGSAEAVGKTLPGQINILKQEFSNFAGTIIATVLPTLTAMLKLLMDHKDILVPLIAVFGGLTAAVIAVNLATKAWAAMQAIAEAATVAWTGVQWLLNAALSANPIGIVIVAVGALVAAIIVAYKTSDKFRAIVDAAFQAVLDVAKSLFNWLKSNWPLLLAILTGPIGVATLAIVKNWDTIKNTTQDVWRSITGFVGDAVDGVKSLLTGLAGWVSGFATGAWTTAINGIRNVFGWISDAARFAIQQVKDGFNGLVGFIEGIVGGVSKAASAVANAIKAPINWLIKGWNSLEFHVPEVKIPKVHIPLVGDIGGGKLGGFNVGFPDLPMLARGGVISSPTLAMVGEGSGREIVSPENLLRQIVGEQSVNVRVFIGNTELKDMVDSRIDHANTGLARGLLAGGAG